VQYDVCMTAAMLVLEPIFEADLPPEQYALLRDNLQGGRERRKKCDSMCVA
jgi:hypothetical protein